MQSQSSAALARIEADYQRSTKDARAGLRNSEVGSGPFLEYARSLYSAEWRHIEALQSAGALPAIFTIGASLEVFKLVAIAVPMLSDDAEFDRAIPALGVTEKERSSGPEPTAVEQEQLAVLQGLEKAYRVAHKKITAGWKAAPIGTHIRRRYDNGINFLNDEHNRNLRSLGVLPENLVAAETTEPLRYVTLHDPEQGLSYARPTNRAELLAVLKKSRDASLAKWHVSAEDNEVRNQLEREYGTETNATNNTGKG